MKLLLIDDSKDICKALERALYTDFSVDIAYTGSEGICKALTDNYSIIILDLNLPDMTGYEVCESLRQQNISAPIIILSAETKILSKISLLDAGANDYLTKPFSLGELKVRIRALIRNSTAVIAKPNNIVFEDLELDSSKRSVIRAGQIISLRRKEFALLECLIQNAGDAVSRKKLIRHAWTEADSPWKNTIDVHIKYLRDKVDKPFGFDLIRTVHGYGYRLAPNPALPRKR